MIQSLRLSSKCNDRFLNSSLKHTSQKFLSLNGAFILEEGVGPRNSGEGHQLFACPKRENQHKFDTTKRGVT